MPFTFLKQRLFCPLILVVFKGFLLLLLLVSVIFAQERGFDVFWVPFSSSELDKNFRNPSGAPIFQRFTDEDGLSQINVWCILQDSKGFLWVGTFNGLNRYDGNQFLIYRNDFQDKNSLSHNAIFSIYETKSGEIWIGTGDGLNRYDQATNSFRIYKFDENNPKSLRKGSVKAIFEDREGTLWVGTSHGGLSKFDRASESFTHYQNIPDNAESLSNNNVFGIGEDEKGELWVATAEGLNKFNRQNESFIRYQANKNKPNSLSENLIRAMFIDRKGMIWLGTYGGGLNLFNPLTEQFTHYKSDKSNPNSLSNNYVFSIYETKGGDLWVGTAQGLNVYQPATNDFVYYKHDITDIKSLPDNDIYSIYEDINEQLWVGTASGGLSKFNQKTRRFQQFKPVAKQDSIIGNDILSIFEDSKKTIWVGTRTGGLKKYNPETKRFDLVKEIGESPVLDIMQDRTGRFWFGTEGEGLFYRDEAGGKIIKYRASENSDSLGKSLIRQVYQDRDGIIWLATLSNGLYKLDENTGKLTNYQYDANNPNSLSNNKVHSLLEDSNGNIWVATIDGLNKFNKQTETFIRIKHTPNDFKTPSDKFQTGIYEAKDGILWIGTGSGGLNRFDPTTGIFTYFTERDGLPNDHVYDILPDDFGNLWLSTDKGLARFNPETKTFRNFDITDGLTNNEFNFGAIFKNSSGQMFFGGRDGFVKFDPKDFADSDFKPPIYLTNIRILEQPLKTEQNISELKELNLSWRDYVVSFDFVALDLTKPKKLQYQWKLENFDDDWIHGGTRHTATYTNLPGGDYVLKIKATNTDGVWSEESVNLRIKVTPPFYRTFSFYGLVIGIIGLLIWLVYCNRISQLYKISETQTKFT